MESSRQTRHWKNDFSACWRDSDADGKVYRNAAPQCSLESSALSEVFRENEKIEHDREFCCHQITHLLDVARIAYIKNLEAGLGIDKELIYTAAILHDIGKALQYTDKIPHEIAGEKIAGEILDTLSENDAFSETERAWILEAVRGHRRKCNGMSEVARLFL